MQNPLARVGFKYGPTLGNWALMMATGGARRYVDLHPDRPYSSQNLGKNHCIWLNPQLLAQN